MGTVGVALLCSILRVIKTVLESYPTFLSSVKGVATLSRELSLLQDIKLKS